MVKYSEWARGLPVAAGENPKAVIGIACEGKSASDINGPRQICHRQELPAILKDCKAITGSDRGVGKGEQHLPTQWINRGFAKIVMEYLPSRSGGNHAASNCC